MSHYISAGEQSRIFAGDGGYQGNIKGKTTLEGGLITSTGAAEDAGLNSHTTSSLVLKDIQNHSSYEGDSIGISASASYSNTNTGATKSLGYGTDSDSQSSTTQSGINTKNLTITDTKAQEATGVDIDTIKAQAYTTTTTDTAQEHSGALVNTFDAAEVQKELDVSTRVTQNFDSNRQELKTQLNTKIDNAQQKKEDAEAILDKNPFDPKAIKDYNDATKQIEERTDVNLKQEFESLMKMG